MSLAFLRLTFTFNIRLVDFRYGVNPNRPRNEIKQWDHYTSLPVCGWFGIHKKQVAIDTINSRAWINHSPRPDLLISHGIFYPFFEAVNLRLPKTFRCQVYGKRFLIFSRCFVFVKIKGRQMSHLNQALFHSNAITFFVGGSDCSESFNLTEKPSPCKEWGVREGVFFCPSPVIFPDPRKQAGEGGWSWPLTRFILLWNIF